MLSDPFNRIHNYLRISVTDRCNLRCRYCMPEEGVQFLPHDRLLSFEDIEKVVRVGAELGINRLRITGGEPLVRPHLEQLIHMLAGIPGIDDIALTTNGIFLADRARALKEAGVKRVNISLDTLRPDRFQTITRGGKLQRVLDAIDRSYEVGFDPIKINCVLIKGFNDDEIADFLALSVERPISVRFIEYMPIGEKDENEWTNAYLPLQAVLDQCQEKGWNYQPVQTRIKGNGPAQNYQIEGAKGTFGLIHPVSNHFCESCNRLRLTADGHLKPCLFWENELDVKPHLNNPESLQELFKRALQEKPDQHEMEKILTGEDPSSNPTNKRFMSQIGG